MQYTQQYAQRMAEWDQIWTKVNIIEEKSKVVAAAWRTEFTQFRAVLAILHQVLLVQNK